MSSIRDEVSAVLDRLSGDLDELLGLEFAELTTPERFAVLERLERVRRRLPVPEHALLNQIAERADACQLGGKLAWAIADRLRITRGEAARRIEEAADLGERRGGGGEPLKPVLAACAAAQHDGDIGASHLKVIRTFLRRLPASVPLAARDAAEAQLADLATRYRPDQLAGAGDRLTDELARDGYTDTDRAARRTVSLGKQDAAGMSPLRGWLTPEARATLDAIFAKWAAPGMCNPADLTPTCDGTPSREAIAADDRTRGQRHHDALVALGRALLASGQLGQHNGLPAAIIVSAGLSDIQAGTGTAHTGGGTWLPMSDVIRMASHAHHYLRLFDDSNGVKELALYHTKRLASPGQRIVLYARDRGCAHPGCPMPGYLTEAHHNEDYATTGRTDIDDLSPRCGPHHKLLTDGGWTTRKRADGTIETLPPAHLDKGQPRTNTFHHPEKLLHTNDDADDEDTTGA